LSSSAQHAQQRWELIKRFGWLNLV
jgi:hypothetical protein